MQHCSRWPTVWPNDRSRLEFLIRLKKAKLMLEKEDLFDGLRLKATDLDWSNGDGALVSCPAEWLVMVGVTAAENESGPVSEMLTGPLFDSGILGGREMFIPPW
jgi:hypothetical protein